MPDGAVPDGGEQAWVVPCDYDTGPGRWAADQAFRPPGTGLFGMVARRIIAGDAAGRSWNWVAAPARWPANWAGTGSR